MNFEMVIRMRELNPLSPNYNIDAARLGFETLNRKTIVLCHG